MKKILRRRWKWGVGSTKWEVVLDAIAFLSMVAFVFGTSLKMEVRSWKLEEK